MLYLNIGNQGMNYLFNKTASIILVAIAITIGVSLTEKIVFASPENSTNSSINEAQIAQASEPIETQPGPDGTQVQLLKTKVVGQILHISFLYLPPSEEKQKYSSHLIDEVNYIDDNTAQQYGVLKNESEVYLASPLDNSKEYFQIDVDEKTPVWFKFPAPSSETQTISINIPGVGPFIGVPVQR